MPAVVDPDRLAALAAATPGAAMAGAREQDKVKFALAAISDLTDAIVGVGAGQLEMRLPTGGEDEGRCGRAALAPRWNALPGTDQVGRAVRRLTQWGQSAVGAIERSLVVQLDPPDESNAWHVRVLAYNDDGGLDPVEVALATSSKSRSKATAAQLARLERLFPTAAPRRSAARRWILSQDEAWD